MLVASTRDRVMAWGLAFCVIAAAGLIGYLFWRKKPAGNFSLGVFVASLLIPALILPSVRHEYIHVSPQQLIIETGTWYRPSRTEIDFKELQTIREQSGGFMPSNLIGDPDVDWHITWRNGQGKILELNDFFTAHRMVVAIYMQDRGFTVTRLEEPTLSVP